MTKRYKIVDDSGVDYNFLRVHREDRWLGEIVEGSDKSVNGCLTVNQPSGDGTWTAPVACFEEVKPEPCITGPDEHLSKLDAARDFVDHLRKRLGYGTIVTSSQLETLANCLDETEVQVRSLWRKYNPLTSVEFAELHSLEMGFMHLVDPMGNQAENLFSAEKHFGVFDPDCSRPRWIVVPHVEPVEREPVMAKDPFAQSPADACVFFHKVGDVDHVYAGWSDARLALGYFGERCEATENAAWLFLRALCDDRKVRSRRVSRKLQTVTTEELRRELTKRHGFTKAQALQIVTDHVESSDETLDVWNEFNTSVTSYKVVK